MAELFDYSELFDCMVDNMRYVVTREVEEKKRNDDREIASLMEIPMRPHHRKMTRGERRARTIAKAENRARKDRKAQREDRLKENVPIDVGRYFKAKSIEAHGWHENKAYGFECKGAHREKEAVVISRGLADYDDSIWIDDTPTETIYKVYVSNGDSMKLVSSVDNFVEADSIAKLVATLANCSPEYSGGHIKKVGMWGITTGFDLVYNEVYWHA